MEWNLKVDLSLDNFVLVLYLTNKCIKKIPSARLLEQLAVSASLAVKAKNGANYSLLVTFSSKKTETESTWGRKNGKESSSDLSHCWYLERLRCCYCLSCSSSSYCTRSWSSSHFQCFLFFRSKPWHCAIELINTGH